MQSAPDLPKGSITAMLRLDHNRATSMLAEKAGVAVADIEKVAIWGNHSPTMFADYRFASAKGKPLPELINDEAWYKNTYLAAVGKRGAAIIEARGLSSAASAANAAIDHVRDWALGSNGKWVSMGLPSDGDYGVPEDIMFGVPVICSGGNYDRVKGLPMDDFAKSRIKHTLDELIEERDAVAELLK
jgi:malate dehydrogenase